MSKATPRNRSILELSADEARAFFLKQESYCTIDLPGYYCFDKLLQKVAGVLQGKSLSGFWSQTPRDSEGVNHLILNNKDGRHAWRPLQLIHPALYVSLVNRITEADQWGLICRKFKEFSDNEKIRCLSLPVESLTEEVDQAEQVSQWWQTVEQRSIELALDYQFVIHTDVIDCYAAIYTHSIAWSLHTKHEAKKQENRRNMALIGNVIDAHIQDMRHGQTNGIPQGSVVMDFIAEMVLGYADLELAKSITMQGIENFSILRYRDDYRIFTNSSQDGERILKCLTEVMIDLGLKLSPAKTKVSSQLIRSSIKADKLGWICRKQVDKSLQKHLLIIHNHSVEYPNAGSLVVALGDFHRRLIALKKCEQPLPLISIVVDIAYRNPRTYPLCAAILSKLISFIKDAGEKKSVVEKAKTKFLQLPNTGHIQIWLQRICFPFAPEVEFEEPICRLMQGREESVWNSDWIASADLRRAVDAKKIIDQVAVKSLSEIVPAEEISLFIIKSEYES